MMMMMAMMMNDGDMEQAGTEVGIFYFFKDEVWSFCDIELKI